MTDNDPSAFYALQRARWLGRDPEPQLHNARFLNSSEEAASTRNTSSICLPTPFPWRDPATLPPRAWVYGQHLLRGQMSCTVGPSGIAKSSHGIVEALAMASGRALLEDRPVGKLCVWLYNLEDPLDELDRRITAAMLHHGIKPEEIGGRLFRDSGRQHPLCTATQVRQGTRIEPAAMDRLEMQIRVRGVDVLIVDPFVSSHQVNENDNGAIDLVAKEWAALADRCNCAIELVHHTRKLSGEEATSESSRGASALLGAARSARVLNPMSNAERDKAGLKNDPAPYFSVTRDKANLAPPGKRVWRRVASVDLGNGDSVGVVEAWEWPDPFEDVSVADLLAVQRAIDGKHPRKDAQANDWAGHIVAEVLGLDADSDKSRIKQLLAAWIKSGALQEERLPDGKSRKRPCLEVGEWASV
ncbi:AAA family ATPase [Rubellimicrobium roseum]|uniref:Recombinase RecA n=1 Tax=Rubellimicrobium roseum TaxID=687525 RepID=A0A5C4N8R5_9RHOB|nr:AAA family ATPase [Rubellimicrobium roseum]TNC61829.1 recombinase RecA [Rubellimicrobium roseum]